jgi:hypothetical protein
VGVLGEYELRYKFISRWSRWEKGDIIEAYEYRRLPENARALCEPMVDAATVAEIITLVQEHARKNPRNPHHGGDK